MGCPRRITAISKFFCPDCTTSNKALIANLIDPFSVATSSGV